MDRAFRVLRGRGAAARRLHPHAESTSSIAFIWLPAADEGTTIGVGSRPPITVPIARQSELWSWEHRDPADRLLAATAAVERIELWHTDTVLKKLTGFPQRYFMNVV